MKKSFTQGLVGSVGTQLNYALSQWAVSIFIVKNLGSLGLGQFTYSLAILAPMLAFAGLGFRSLLSTEKNLDQAYKVLFTRFCLCAAGILLMFIWATQDPRVILPLFLFLGLFKLFDMLDDLLRGIYFFHDEFTKVFYWSLYFSLSNVVICFIFIGIHKNLVAYAAAISILKSSQVFGMYIQSRKRDFFLPTDLKISKSYIKMGVPLGIMALLVALNSNIPKYLLTNYSSTEDLGVFMGLFFFVTAGATLFVAAKNAAAPYLTRIHHKSPPELYLKVIKLQFFVLMFMLVAAVIAYQVADPFLLLIYTSEYHGLGLELAILAVAGGFMYCQSFSTLGLTIKRLLNPQPIITSVSTVAGLVSALYLIPKYGILGASLSFLISSFLIFTLSNIILFKKRHA
ncbi:MAG: hypothetical protein AB8E15_02775 [Bdellovibrionales bacterium]